METTTGGYKSLLDQKLRWLEEKFVNEGGFRENLFRKRIERRRVT
jgi:four helix bundle suffix protein